MVIDAMYLCFHPYEVHRMCSYITTYHTHKYRVITYVCSYKAYKSNNTILFTCVRRASSLTAGIQHIHGMVTLNGKIILGVGVSFN